jgi:hypothetical protein
MSYFFQSIKMRRGKEAYIAEWFQAIIHVSITLKYLKKTRITSSEIEKHQKDLAKGKESERVYAVI